MTSQQRYSLRASAWGTIFGSVATVYGGVPVGVVVTAVMVGLGVGWLMDSFDQDNDDK